MKINQFNMSGTVAAEKHFNQRAASKSFAFFMVMACGIFLSRVTGLIRDRVFAHYFGNSDAADTFKTAFSIPNFLKNLFGEGGLSAPFVYACLLASGNDEDVRRTACAVAALLALITSILVLIGVPMLYITGKADPLNLIEGGVPKLATGVSDKIRAKPKPPVRESILKWAKALGCPMTPVNVPDVNGVRTESYCPGPNGAEVVYITVYGLGHTWAGGRSLLPESIVGATSNRINATESSGISFKTPRFC